MIKRLISAIIITSAVVILPVLGNSEMIRSLHLWVLVIFGVLASILQPAYNPFTITFKPKDKGTGAQIIWSVYITQLAIIIESAYFRYPASVKWDAFSIAGVLLMACGLSLRTWAVLILGNLFTMHIDIQKKHTVITHGPYRIVRHPSYLGAYILYCSTAIFFHAWISAITTALILLMAFIRRIQYEENMLVNELGEDYITYSTKLKRLIPWFW